MDLFLVYLWLKLDSLNGLLGFFMAALVIATFGFWLTVGSSYDSLGFSYCNREILLTRISWAKKIIKRLLISLVVCAVALTTLPSTKDVAILVGVHYANKLVESPEGTKVQTLIRAKTNQLLDQQIKELDKKN